MTGLRDTLNRFGSARAELRLLAGLLAARAERLELSRSDRCRPGHRYPPVQRSCQRREAREQPQLLLALPEPIECVAQPRHALAHPLDLVGEQPVLIFSARLCVMFTPRENGGDAQYQEGQRHHAADPDQRFDERLRHLHGAGRPEP